MIYCEWENEFRNYNGHAERFVAGHPYPPDLLSYLITVQPANHHSRPNRFCRDIEGGGCQSLLERLCAMSGPTSAASLSCPDWQHALECSQKPSSHQKSRQQKQPVEEPPTNGKTMGH